MFCEKCGNELRNGVKFCNKCGQALEKSCVPFSKTLDQTTFVSVTKNVPKKAGKKKIVISVMVTVAVIITSLCWGLGLLTPTLKLYQGDEYSFGGYDWVVLEVFEDSGKALILTKDIVAFYPYNDLYDAVTWENSTVREWLNTDFLKTFTNEEKKQIVEAFPRIQVESSAELIHAPNNGLSYPNVTDTPSISDAFYIVEHGYTGFNYLQERHTQGDSIFLLDCYDISEFLGNKSDFDRREPKIIVDDENNEKRQARVSSSISNPNVPSSMWILRTPGENLNVVMYVNDIGQIVTTGVDVNSELCGIRPALILNLKGAKAN